MALERAVKNNLAAAALHHHRFLATALANLPLV
jgi:hypothetical protein